MEFKPKISIVMVSYNRPLFLKEAITSLFRKPGRADFEFILWDNNSNVETKKLSKELAEKYGFRLIFNSKNIGQIALAYTLEEARGEYFIMLEDDEIWFQDDWLKKMVEGFENKLSISPEGKQLGFKDEWGIIASNVLVDPVNNAGMWKDKLKNKIDVVINGVNYWVNVVAGGGILIFNTGVLKKLNAFPKTARLPNDAMNTVHKLISDHKYPMAYLPNVYIYHACSPFWNKMYRETWNEKQRGTQTIEQAFKIYEQKGNFDWNNEWILDVFNKGQFNEYAYELYKIHTNNRA